VIVEQGIYRKAVVSIHVGRCDGICCAVFHLIKEQTILLQDRMAKLMKDYINMVTGL